MQTPEEKVYTIIRSEFTYTWVKENPALALLFAMEFYRDHTDVVLKDNFPDEGYITLTGKPKED